MESRGGREGVLYIHKIYSFFKASLSGRGYDSLCGNMSFAWTSLGEVCILWNAILIKQKLLIMNYLKLSKLTSINLNKKVNNNLQSENREKGVTNKVWNWMQMNAFPQHVV